MMSLMILTDIKDALMIGVVLAFMVGPVFFMLIETSILKGFKSALAFDLGVMFGDISFLTIAYFGSKPLIQNIEGNPIFFKIGGSLLILYGVFSFFKTKTKDIIQNERLVIKEDSNYVKLFIKGFLLNLINIGTLGFWVGLILVYGSRYQMKITFILYFFGLVLLTYFTLDLVKIVLAKKFRAYLTPSSIFKLKRVVALVLILFGIILFTKDYISKESFNFMEKQMEQHTLD